MSGQELLPIVFEPDNAVCNEKETSTKPIHAMDDNDESYLSDIDDEEFVRWANEVDPPMQKTQEQPLPPWQNNNYNGNNINRPIPNNINRPIPPDGVYRRVCYRYKCIGCYGCVPPDPDRSNKVRDPNNPYRYLTGQEASQDMTEGIQSALVDMDTTTVNNNNNKVALAFAPTRIGTDNKAISTNPATRAHGDVDVTYAGLEKELGDMARLYNGSLNEYWEIMLVQGFDTTQQLHDYLTLQQKEKDKVHFEALLARTIHSLSQTSIDDNSTPPFSPF